MPYPYAEARLLLLSGQLRLRRGEPGPAREHLEAALAIFRRLGARKDIEQGERDLAVLQRQYEAQRSAPEQHLRAEEQAPHVIDPATSAQPRLVWIMGAFDDDLFLWTGQR